MTMMFLSQFPTFLLCSSFRPLIRMRVACKLKEGDARNEHHRRRLDSFPQDKEKSGFNYSEAVSLVFLTFLGFTTRMPSSGL